MLSDKTQRFIQLYQKLNKDNLRLLSEIYHGDIQFTDPLHSLQGIDALTRYFSKLYENVTNINFVIDDVIEGDNQAGIYWTMHFTHNALRKGQPITVVGHSRLRFSDGLVICHQDYFDTNSMLFDHVPVLGGLMRMLKSRAAQ